MNIKLLPIALELCKIIFDRFVGMHAHLYGFCNKGVLSLIATLTHSYGFNVTQVFSIGFSQFNFFLV